MSGEAEDGGPDSEALKARRHTSPGQRPGKRIAMAIRSVVLLHGCVNSRLEPVVLDRNPARASHGIYGGDRGSRQMLIQQGTESKEQRGNRGDRLLALIYRAPN